jgi:hypothetical protein
MNLRGLGRDPVENERHRDPLALPQVVEQLCEVLDETTKGNRELRELLRQIADERDQAIGLCERATDMARELLDLWKESRDADE